MEKVEFNRVEFTSDGMDPSYAWCVVADDSEGFWTYSVLYSEDEEREHWEYWTAENLNNDDIKTIVGLLQKAIQAAGE